MVNGSFTATSESKVKLGWASACEMARAVAVSVAPVDATVRAASEFWISVTDAEGVVKFSRNCSPGPNGLSCQPIRYSPLAVLDAVVWFCCADTFWNVTVGSTMPGTRLPSARVKNCVLKLFATVLSTLTSKLG